MSYLTQMAGLAFRNFVSRWAGWSLWRTLGWARSSLAALVPGFTAAYYQVPRIAKVRGISQAQVNQVINDHIQGRFLGIFGEPYVNVLDLNLALDALQ
jgi:hypothetical protein